MKVQFFSVNALAPEIDQQALNSFCASHRVVNIEKHLLNQEESPFWSVCITYLEASNALHQIKATSSRCFGASCKCLSVASFA